MKKAIAIILMSVAMLAWAGTRTILYTSDGTGLASGATDPGPNLIGVPLMVDGRPVKSLVVTIADFRDGGANDHQQVGNGRLIALLGKPNVSSTFDGGVQWSRYPAFDIEVDGGNPFIPANGGAITYSLQLNSASLGLGTAADRLMFYSQNVIAADGGALPHRVLIEAAY